jgi:hypothetical protein
MRYESVGKQKYGAFLSISDLGSDDYTISEPPNNRNKGRMINNA